MHTVQMTLDESLVVDLDRVTHQLHTTRSAFARQALREAIERLNAQSMESKHREGYEKHPVAGDEFSLWDSEHAWGDK